MAFNELPNEIIENAAQYLGFSNDLISLGCSCRYHFGMQTIILKNIYKTIYKQPADINSNQLLLSLKQALWPDYRKNKSVFYAGEFGDPDQSASYIDDKKKI